MSLILLSQCPQDKQDLWQRMPSSTHQSCLSATTRLSTVLQCTRYVSESYFFFPLSYLSFLY